jgi:hypothetical protein
VNKVNIRMTAAQRTKLLRSAAVEAEIRRRTNAIHAAAGGDAAGYRAETAVNTRRARGAVYTYDLKAVKDNAKNNTLVRSLEAGRHG